ncbi:hypothetical protein ABQD81_13065 [Enterococcus casseliflavus]
MNNRQGQTLKISKDSPSFFFFLETSRYVYKKNNNQVDRRLVTEENQRCTAM